MESYLQQHQNQIGPTVAVTTTATRPTPPPKPSHLVSRHSGNFSNVVNSTNNNGGHCSASSSSQQQQLRSTSSVSLTQTYINSNNSSGGGDTTISPDGISGNTNKSLQKKSVSVPPKPRVTPPLTLLNSVTTSTSTSDSTPNSDNTTNNSNNLTPQQQQAMLLAQRKRKVKDFQFGKPLGEGSYSSVVEATEIATQRTYAAKILYKRHILKEKKTKYVKIERDVLHALNHPFIVKLYYAFQDQDSLFLILDLAANGELLTWIRKLGSFPLHCARFYLAEIVVAVEYMHSKNIIHRDLKPENILLGEDMHILVTDFGTAFQCSSSSISSSSEDGNKSSSLTQHQQQQQPLPNLSSSTTLTNHPSNKPINNTSGDDGRGRGGRSTRKSSSSDDSNQNRANSFVGTAEYVSPELLKDKAVTKASDVWAIGCIAYQLIAGRPPFKAPNEYLTFQKILKLDYSFPPGFNPQLRDLVEQILVLDPKRRIGLDKVKEHPFFAGINFNSLTQTAPPRLIPPPSQAQTQGGGIVSSSSNTSLSHAQPQTQPHGVVGGINHGSTTNNNGYQYHHQPSPPPLPPYPTNSSIYAANRSKHPPVANASSSNQDIYNLDTVPPLDSTTITSHNATGNGRLKLGSGSSSSFSGRNNFNSHHHHGVRNQQYPTPHESLSSYRLGDNNNIINYKGRVPPPPPLPPHRQQPQMQQLNSAYYDAANNIAANGGNGSNNRVNHRNDYYNQQQSTWDRFKNTVCCCSD
ncbi:serine/threonine protein kinase [Mycoemilia scoparia]|uniref:non-specific serine/threonine protein kinase n=1 Tax=Mycoemilia scoparia TaxID=417184 RepID=A0A9W8A0F7_9FUNG|nr:serine/threonine protein kinase [Mycoemilia scoparia]